MEDTVQITQEEPKKKKKKTPIWLEIVRLLVKIILIILIIYALFTFVFGLHRNLGIGMNPAIKNGDLVLYYRLDTKYSSGDVIVIEYQGQIMEERVIAVEGDKVDITERGLMVNGSRVQEADIYYDTLVLVDGISLPLTVGKGEVFVLGDNRENATDSRLFGCVSIEDIRGKVIGIFRRRSI